MKLLLPIIFLLLTSCNSNEIRVIDTPLHWSESQKRQYFIDSIAYRNYNGRFLKQSNSLNNADTFFKKAYGIKSDYYLNTCILYALEENFIDSSKIGDHTNTLRITIDPTFQIPYGIVLKQTENTNTLTGKMTDGHGGYYSGYLDLAVRQNVSTSFANQIFDKLEKMDFFNLPSNIEMNGSDGESWRIELIKNGQYHSITRWTPNHYGDSVTLEIGKLGIELRDTSKLFEHWALQIDNSKAYKNIKRQLTTNKTH